VQPFHQQAPLIAQPFLTPVKPVAGVQTIVMPPQSQQEADLRSTLPLPSAAAAGFFVPSVQQQQFEMQQQLLYVRANSYQLGISALTPPSAAAAAAAACALPWP
jgi:hypothetical protein